MYKAKTLPAYTPGMVRLLRAGQKIIVVNVVQREIPVVRAVYAAACKSV
jgi:hypothetical protein